MHALLPESREIRVTQKLGRVTAEGLSAVDQLLLILPKRPSAAVWRRIPQGKKLQALMKKKPAGDVPALESRLANKRQTLVVAGSLKADASAFEQLTLGRKLVAAATSQKAGSLGICAIGFDSESQARIVNNMLAAALAAAFRMPAWMIALQQNEQGNSTQ